MFQRFLKFIPKQKVSGAAREVWERFYLVLLAGCAGYVEWEKERQLPVFFGFVTVVEPNLNKKLNLWVQLMKIGAATGCQRSFSVFGYQFPVCARCTGLGIGQIAGLIFSFFLREYNITVLFIFAIAALLLLGIDGAGQFYKKWESTNFRRVITGLLCGFSVILFINKLFFELVKMIIQFSGA